MTRFRSMFPQEELSISKNGSWVRILDRSILTCLLVLSVLLNIALSIKLHQLSAGESHNRLAIGTSVPPIEATVVNGPNQQLRYSDSTLPTLLYVFTPQCGWCKKNLPNLQALARANNSSYRLIGVSLSDTDLISYLEKNHITFPIYSHVSARTISIYHLGGTPSTLLISPEGQIKEVWTGAYLPETQAKIEQTLHVSLPGCCAVPAVAGQ